MKILAKCRICLLSVKNYSKLFNYSEINAEFLIADFVMKCASVKLNENDEFSKIICSKCLENLNIAYQFKTTCEQSDQILRNRINLETNKRKEKTRKKCRKIDISLETTNLNEIESCIESIKSEDGTNSFNDKSKDGKIKFPLNCILCDKLMLDPKEMIEHCKNNHQQQQICPYCNKLFHLQRGLKKHMSVSHKFLREIVCNFCDARFTLDESRKRHEKKRHQKQLLTSFRTKLIQINQLNNNRFNMTKQQTRFKLFEENNQNQSNNIENIQMNSSIYQDFVKIPESDNLNKSTDTPFECKEGRYDDNVKDSDISKLFDCVSYPINCVICNLEILDVLQMRRHCNETHQDYFICIFCNKKLCSAQRLMVHISGVHKRLKPFSCQFCQAKFTSHDGRLSHVRALHLNKLINNENLIYSERTIRKRQEFDRNDDELTQLEKQFKVSSSTTIFSTFTVEQEECYDGYVTDADIPKLFACCQYPSKCCVCKKIVSDVFEMREHNNELHSNLYLCIYCNKTLCSAQRLMIHISSVHKRLRPFACKFCDIRFSEMDSRNKHYRAVHFHQLTLGENENERIVENDDLYEDLDENEIKGCLKYPIECVVCHEKIESKTLMKEHCQKLHLFNFVCIFCNKSLSSKYVLKHHVRVVHKQSLFEPYACLFCEDRFKHPQSRLIHVQKYHLEQLYFNGVVTFNDANQISEIENDTQDEEELKTNLEDEEEAKNFNKLSYLKELYNTCETYPQQCLICSKTFDDLNDIQNHYSLNHSDSIFCIFCNYKCSNYNSLSTHLSIVHPKMGNGKKYRCAFCDITFKSSIICLDHVQISHSTLIYNCKICQQKFLFKNNAQAHAQLFKNGECKHKFLTKILKNFKRKKQYNYKPRLHCRKMSSTGFKKSKLTKILKFECSDCGEILKSRSQLRQHRFDKHNIKEIKLNFCKFCEQKPVFATKQQLQSHIFKLHKQTNESLLCPHCGKTLSSDSNLRRHIFSVHLKTSEHECQTCKRQFYDLSSLKNHRCKPNEMYSCEICGKCYTKRSLLKYHLEQHSQEKQFKCQFCDKSFHARKNLYTHKRTHGELKYKCCYCNKRFAVKKYLIKHSYTHTGEKPLECKYCDQSFRQWLSLNIHVKKYHSNLVP